MNMNTHAIRAIYRFEMSRTFRTALESILSPVLSTSLYFIVFGAAIGSRMGDLGGVSYGAFIIPGLIMLSLLNESISNASFGIYLPKWSGTIFELLSAPVSYFEAVIGYVGAAATKSLMLGVLILVTARLFVPYQIAHPFWMLCFLLLTAVTFSLFGFIIGIWADSFQRLQVIPLLIVTPLTFLGGAFYSIDMLPEPWRTFTLFNPVVYLVSGMRWSFYGIADVNVWLSAGAIVGFLIACLVGVWWIFKTGYKIKAGGMSNMKIIVGVALLAASFAATPRPGAAPAADRTLQPKKKPPAGGFFMRRGRAPQQRPREPTRFGDVLPHALAIHLRGQRILGFMPRQIAMPARRDDVADSTPPSRRAITCSAVHWKWTQSSSRRPCCSANAQAFFVHIGRIAVVAAVSLLACGDFAEATELVVVGHCRSLRRRLACAPRRCRAPGALRCSPSSPTAVRRPCARLLRCCRLRSG